MSVCVDHPEKTSSTDCNGCRRSFCDGCLVRFEKLALCATCKSKYLTGVEDRAVPGRSRPAAPASVPGRAGAASSSGAPGAARRGTPLQWIGGSTALVFAAVFVFLIVASLAEPFTAWRHDRRHADALDTLVTIGSALERHRAQTGALPATLDDLVPAFLASVPRDPYGKAPPRYDRARLWSVGENGTDDEGESPADLVYRVD